MAKKSNKVAPPKAQSKSTDSKATLDADPIVKIENKKSKLGNRAKNFTEEEDLLLCRSYVHCSLDSVNGADQKASTFWLAVFTKFKDLYGMAEVVVEDSRRNNKSLENRYKRHIQHDAMEWLGLYKGNGLNSGETKEDHFNRISEMYLEKYGRVFRFKHCMETLMALPKFDPNLREEDPVMDDSDRSSIGQPSNFSNMAATLARPVGKKKAKYQDLKEGLGRERLKAFQALSRSVDKLAGAMAKREEREYLMGMWKTFREAGEMTLAAEYFAKLRSLENNEDNRQAAGGMEKDGSSDSQEEQEEDLSTISAVPSASSSV